MKRITPSDIEALIARAASSDRKRSNLNIHEQAEDPVQRLFIASKSDSYFRPHRHPKTWEFAIVLQGAFDILLFDDRGTVTDRFRTGPGSGVSAFELPANVWHTWIPVTETAVFFETKQGPYDPAVTAEFAPWSPAEGSPEVASFNERLKSGVIGMCVGKKS